MLGRLAHTKQHRVLQTFKALAPRPHHAIKIHAELNRDSSAKDFHILTPTRTMGLSLMAPEMARGDVKVPQHLSSASHAPHTIPIVNGAMEKELIELLSI